MKPAAFVGNGASLEHSLEELRAFDGKIFATPKAHAILEVHGIRAQSLGDPLGVTRIFNFGHKRIHLYGFDLCHANGEGMRVAFANRVFYTTQELATHAQMLLKACMELTGKGAELAIHGEGMFPHMARTVMADARERVLTAIYDMQVSPPTYEVFSFLSQAEKYRHERGFTALDIIFFPGPIEGFRDDGLPPSASERASMLHRICVGGARLLPSVRNIHVMSKRSHVEGDVFPPDWTNDRPRFCYGPRFQKNAYQCLEATKAARDEISLRFKSPYTTITLREADYWPKRNSNKKAWEQAAKWLQQYRVPAVVVPDTHGGGIDGAHELQAAAWDIDLRLALYEGAALNLGVMNGPMVLPMFAKKAPAYLIFQKPDEESPGTQAAFMAAQGIRAGEGYTSNGETVWTDDTPENVLAALEHWRQSISEKAA